MDDMKTIREALANLKPAPAHQADTPPKIDDIYTPSGHESALDPDRPLVVGGRGVGKSFWSGALVDKKTRAIVDRRYPKLGLNQCHIKLGFVGADTQAGGAPSKEILSELLIKDKFKADVIWRAVFLHCLREHIDTPLPTPWGGVNGLVAWANEDAERLQLTLRAADQRLSEQNLRLVVVFDALDRLGDDWPQIRELSKNLLRVALAMRGYRAIKPKIFMRVDQAEDPSLTSFPDASKLIGEKVVLSWERKDLYGLLFSLLARHKLADEPFRRLIVNCLNTSVPEAPGDGLPIEINLDEQGQTRLFTALAGPYMGNNPRQGKTYTWVHNHLADTFGFVSPRSFLETFRVAAQRVNPATNNVLDPKGLQSGLQAASSLRVTQLHEEYGWIRAALESLADLRVPCELATLFERWKNAETLTAIQHTAKTEGFLQPAEFLPDQDTRAQHQSLLDALRRIGVAEQRPDGRINIPDIYRIAAKLLRKGGVTPNR